MVRDRLAELRERAGLLPQTNGSSGNHHAIAMDDIGGSGDHEVTIEMRGGYRRPTAAQNENERQIPPRFSQQQQITSIEPSGSSSSMSAPMNQLFSRITMLQSDIKNLSNMISDVRRLHDNVLFATNEQSAMRSREQRDELMLKIQQLANELFSELQRMRKSPEMSSQFDANGAAVMPVELRIRRNQFQALSLSYREVMEDYNHVQVMSRDKSKDNLKRQLRITGKMPDDDAALDDMLERGDVQVFTQGIVDRTEAARMMMHDIEERHNDIIKLERSLKELNALFLDMAMLVESQGEVLDNVERNVTTASAAVVEGSTQLRRAKTMQKKARRKMICLVILILIIIAVNLLILHFYAKLF